MILPIYVYGFPLLRKPGKDIESNYPRLNDIISDMFETMYASEGVGLAAQQVGFDIKLFVLDTDPYSEKYPDAKDFKRVFINSEILEEEGDLLTFDEGCLSFPGIREDVTRKSRIKIRYLDEKFEEHIEFFEGIKARVILHEFDHNKGVFFIDRISPLRRMLLKKRLNNISTGNVDVKYKIKFPINRYRK